MPKSSNRRKEKRLRKEIMQILESIADTDERVNDQCGIAEYGLDIVMTKKDVFGQPRAIGLQIKVGKIHCSVRGNASVKELIGQLAVAYGQEVTIDDKSYQLDCLYVVTDGDITPTAREYIKKARVGQRGIHFIDRQSLGQFRNLTRKQVENRVGRESMTRET